MRHFHNFLFLAVILLIESTVLGIFFQLTVAFEYLQKPNTINPLLALIGFSLLGTLFKLIFEGWLIYSISIFREVKRKIIQTNKEMLKSRIISAKLFIISFIVPLILILLSTLYKDGLIPMLIIFGLGVCILMVYIISIMASYYLANKHITRHSS